MFISSGFRFPLSGFLFCLFTLHFPTLLPACGVSWSLPTNHFEGVEERGYVSLWRQIGQLDLTQMGGEELKLPLNLNFKSSRETDSPYVGKGWMLALLESHIVQVNEKKFRVVMPDGWNKTFYRKTPTATLLEGSGWKAQIDGDKISAWASCGWRLDYVKGKIVGMQSPKNRTISYLYQNGKVDEVRVDGATALKVKWDDKGERAVALQFGNQEAKIEYGERPRLELIGDKSVVGGIDKALKRITVTGEGNEVAASGINQETFEFAVDDGIKATAATDKSVKVQAPVAPQKLNPSLTIHQEKLPERKIVWDATTKRVIQDGVWTYQITPDEKNALANAAIGRTNTQGQKEFWHEDKVTGQEIVQSIDGVKKITKQFASGKLAGKIRSIEESNNNFSGVIFEASYDEEGRLIRSSNTDTIVSVRYNTAGRVAVSEVLGSDTINSQKKIRHGMDDREEYNILKNGDGAVISIHGYGVNPFWLNWKGADL